MKVSEVMSRQIETIALDANALEAAQKMRDGDFGVLPVMDGANVVGMITDRDLTVRVLADGLDPQNTQVEDVMTAETLCCRENDSVEEAADMMAENQVRRLIVMDENNKFCGILSLGDVAVSEEGEASEALSGISQPRHDEPNTYDMEELSRH